MQFGIVGIITTSICAIIVLLGMTLDFDVEKAGAWLAIGASLLLLVLCIAEYRKRAKMFTKKK